MEGKPLREVTVKIGLERIDTQEGITVEALLDSGATGLVMSSEFARKQGFKLKKLERPIQVRNVDGSFNKKMSRSLTVDCIFYFLFALYFYFYFYFSLFSIFRTTRVRIYQSHCHISHKLIAKSQD